MKRISAPTKNDEIEKLERMLGNNAEKLKSDRAARRAISSLRAIWAADPTRKSNDISVLTQGIEWRWPIRIYTPGQLAEKEAAMRQMLSERANVDILREV